jgi:hypothetical protein
MSAAGITWTADDVETWGQSEDMSAAASYGKIVVLNATEGRVQFADAVTEKVHGVIVKVSVDSTAGRDVGVVPVSCGKIAHVFVRGAETAIAVEDLIGASTTDGAGIVTTTDGHHVVGKALAASTANGDLISVALGHNQAAS